MNPFLDGDATISDEDGLHNNNASSPKASQFSFVDASELERFYLPGQYWSSDSFRGMINDIEYELDGNPHFLEPSLLETTLAADTVNPSEIFLHNPQEHSMQKPLHYDVNPGVSAPTPPLIPGGALITILTRSNSPPPTSKLFNIQPIISPLQRQPIFTGSYENGTPPSGPGDQGATKQPSRLYRCAGGCHNPDCVVSYTSRGGLYRHRLPPKQRRIDCDGCGTTILRSNIARHKKESCPRTLLTEAENESSTS